MKSFPTSIAIAGAWGYIGRKFLDAALRLGIRPYVYDPGPAPADVALGRVVRIGGEEEFYRLDADLFHLALHPEHRRRGTEILLARASSRPILILNEKPMASPERPEQCDQIIRAVDASAAVMVYDFPELFDPLTEAITGHLARYERVEIRRLYVQRSKDREARENPRNYKRMVPIQFQESVHCLAFALYLLGRHQGSVESLFDGGVVVDAQADPYDPPNPEAYPYVVDGRCHYRLRLGRVDVEGLTDFKRNAAFSKRRVIEGMADGRPFLIEADYLEGGKRLAIDGKDQGWDAASNSYEQVIRTLARWYQEDGADRLRKGVYPNPRFARLTYQLSAMLWKSSHDRRSMEAASLGDLLNFDAGFAAAVPRLPRYAPRSTT